MFLPLGGRRDGDAVTVVDGVGTSGRYWSSTANKDNIREAWYLSFNTGEVRQWKPQGKHNGANVRLVSYVK